MTSSSPPPPPPTSATPRRRRLLPSSAGGGGSSSSTNSSSSSPFVSSFPPPTSPSPFHRFLPSPLRASSVPFSWEHRPGIPKTPARPSRSSSKQQLPGVVGGGKHYSPAPPLPLPPSLLSRAASDPYASAVVPAEYAAAGAMPPPPGYYYTGGTKARRLRLRLRRRRPRLADALADWLSVLSLYRSCKRAVACFAAKAKPPPPPPPAP